MVKLTDAQVSVYKKYLSQWQDDSRRLLKTYRFEDSDSAMAFVENLIPKARQLSHTPEIRMSGNAVTLILSTVDEEGEGITGKDFALAMEAEKLYQSLQVMSSHT